MCGGGPDNHHAITVAADLPPPPPSVVAVEMAPPRGHRPGKEVEYNEEEEDDDDEYDGREFEEEFLRFSMMVDEEDDDGDDDDEVEVEIIAVVSPPHRPLVGARGTTSAVESVTNLQARTSPLPNPVVPQTGTKASKRGDSGAKAKPAAAKKRRSKHGFLGVHQRTYGRWSAEIRDNVIKGSRFWIGTFDTALDAALAYDAVSRRLYGLNAKTNFPAAAGEDDLPPPPPPAKPCSSTKRPKKCNTSGDLGAAAAPPQAVDTPAAAAAGVELTSLLCSVAAQAQEVSDGWEFIQELLLLGGGVSPLDYLNGQELAGAAVGDLWSF
ncbi:ethylene-responsive transcription factor ERF023 [Oryza sativa Japonica Group]|uniref:AP2 domain containing protein, expressed n=1 Tax=Oryza sativa subsp. japonica TaxID=39947 RepID=Q2QMI3_ORYSJ|nr:ethylene-responsive transcription factor ERF023 [Oryza sativa Japonica Group]ABA99811.1 AP2 domain containing protein, expressed [Oryza sativa Japonica Group]BAT17966.1 Os12g0603300 [Oryza sativa Japonica Group]